MLFFEFNWMLVAVSALRSRSFFVPNSTERLAARCALTAMSPLQHQKHLRLHAAREKMLMEGMDATGPAYEVGYESQFNREYSRLFGQPPDA